MRCSNISMHKPPRERGVAFALTWYLLHIVAVGGGATFVVLRTWQHTHSRTQTTLAVVMFAAVLKIISIRQRVARRNGLKRQLKLPRYYDSDGTTAI